MTTPNLDDENQTVFYIPFIGDDDIDEDEKIPLSQTIYPERALNEQEHLRVKAYKEAWQKCLGRVKSINQILQASLVADIVDSVRSAHDNILPGLPYPELPAICIKDPMSSFVCNITSQLDTPDLGDALFETPSLTAHLYPTDCANLVSAMKNMISGFIDRPDVLDKVKSRPTMSLANYDIEMLCSWYAAVRMKFGIKEEFQPKLVVLLHDFEQFDPVILQDVLSISSLYVSRLPLVFLLLCSSPASPSYLHVTYPRSTLALLRIHTFTAHSGPDVLEEILLKTFFDLGFKPDIMIGPEMLQYLIDAFIRHNPSFDALLSGLHLAHLKHFSLDPFTLLVQSTPSAEVLAHSTSGPFVKHLSARLQLSFQPDADIMKSIIDLTSSVDNARDAFHLRALRLRLGFAIMRTCQQFLINYGYKGLGWNSQSGDVTLLQVMIDILRNDIQPDIKVLASLLKKLKPEQLNLLLNALSGYFHSLPLEIKSGEEQAYVRLVFFNELSTDRHGDATETSAQLAKDFSEWLTEYLKSLIVPLENSILWDLWFTGETEFPADLVNPSFRPSIVSGLLHPHRYAELYEDEDNPVGYSLWEHPDTSILFRRYLDSGKMINVYDWFEAFQVVLETQHKNLKEERRVKKVRSPSKSPSKHSKKGKRSAKTAKAEGDEDKEEEGEGDEDARRLQIQARFIRALHELDYLGFIKHTRRKADHVLRTIFDLHD